MEGGHTGWDHVTSLTSETQSASQYGRKKDKSVSKPVCQYFLTMQIDLIFFCFDIFLDAELRKKVSL